MSDTTYQSTTAQPFTYLQAATQMFQAAEDASSTEADHEQTEQHTAAVAAIPQQCSTVAVILEAPTRPTLKNEWYKDAATLTALKEIVKMKGGNKKFKYNAQLQLNEAAELATQHKERETLLRDMIELAKVDARRAIRCEEMEERYGEEESWDAELWAEASEYATQWVGFDNARTKARNSKRKADALAKQQSTRPAKRARTTPAADGLTTPPPASPTAVEE